MILDEKFELFDKSSLFGYIAINDRCTQESFDIVEKINLWEKIDDDNIKKVNIEDSTEIPYFISRYNEHELHGKFQKQNYYQNKDIQRLVKELGIDAEKFWYYLLYIYDLSYTACMDGIVLQDVSASKMYFEIWKYILENLATGNTLTIKIKSKNDKEWITTSNPSIIRALFHKKYRVPLNEIGGNDISKTSPDKKEFTVTLFKLTFTRLLERLFEQLESVRKQRRKNAGISNMENLLIIALIQFTGIDTIKHKDEVHSLRLTRLKYNDFIFFHPSFNFL